MLQKILTKTLWYLFEQKLHFFPPTSVHVLTSYGKVDPVWTFDYIRSSAIVFNRLFKHQCNTMHTFKNEQLNGYCWDRGRGRFRFHILQHYLGTTSRPTAEIEKNIKWYFVNTITLERSLNTEVTKGVLGTQPQFFVYFTLSRAIFPIFFCFFIVTLVIVRLSAKKNSIDVSFSS